VKLLNNQAICRRPKNKESKQPLPSLEYCSEPVHVAAIIAKLSAQKGEQCVRIGSSDVTKALETLRRHAAAARRDKAKEVVSFDLKIPSERRVTVILRSEGLEALWHFSGNLGILAPMVMKACERVNNSHFEKDVRSRNGSQRLRFARDRDALRSRMLDNCLAW
jgi:hypothetical protein